MSSKIKDDESVKIYRFRPTVDSFAGGQKYSSGKKNGEVRYYESPIPIKPNKYFEPVGVVSGDACLGSDILKALDKTIRTKNISEAKKGNIEPSRDPYKDWHDKTPPERKMEEAENMIAHIVEAIKSTKETKNKEGK